MPWPGESYSRQIPPVPQTPPHKSTSTTAPAPGPKRATSFEPEVAAAFGTVVREARRRQSIAQDQFALLANVDRSYFGKLERGERQPSLALMLRVATGLGCSGTELMAEVEKQLAAANRPAAEAPAPPAAMNTAALRMLYAHLGRDAVLALRVDKAVRDCLAEGWRDHPAQVRRVRNAIRYVLNTVIPADLGLAVQDGDAPRPPPPDLDQETDRLLAKVLKESGY